MPLYEYFCEKCQRKFEQITSSNDPDQGKCPKCFEKSSKKLISRFAVGGQGDLRESTLHGCHDCGPGLDGHSHVSDDGHHHHDSEA
jgi:putative FmdB family regulatory protein